MMSTLIDADVLHIFDKIKYKKDKYNIIIIVYLLYFDIHFIISTLNNTNVFHIFDKITCQI